MFTWICPKCGREVGPSYSECPFCAEAAAATTQAVAPAPVAPQPQYAPPQAQYPPQPQYQPPVPPQPQYVPPPQAPPPPVAAPAPPPPPPPQTYLVGVDDNKRAIPGWLAAVLAFVAVGAVAGGVVYFTSSGRSSGAAAAKAAIAEKQRAAGDPYAKFLELTGFRINEGAGKKLQVQFLAVNHGSADLADIEGVVTLRVKGDANAEPAVVFPFKISSLPANGAKEIEVKDFKQKRKFFDMPDWLFLEPQIEFTSTP